ncbi:MAG TPA: efflux RND transporter periplasmic adaptor subunit [Roseiarcus sp.]|jgi:multidrug resistance efflux pump
MSGVELKANDVKTLAGIKRRSVLSSVRVVPVLITAVVVALAAALGWQAWQYYMGAPWTRDGTVRAYVVKIAPEVAGQIVKLPIVDNQFVHKGDLLMLIDPRNYSIAVRQAEAAVEQARATAENANAEMIRREKLNDVAVTMEERQTYISQAATAEANYQSALANLDQARINLRRTEVRSPVNGYITNLTAQLGDYANVGDLQLSVVNSDSYWVDAYFEETALGRIHKGDAATIKLMGYSPLLRGRVQGLARGINVPNAAPDASGLASVNPIFTFVRLAQRVPVRIHIDEVPEGVELVAGLTATVQVEPYQAPPSSQSAPPQAAPSQLAKQATPSAPSSKAADQAASRAAQPQAVLQPPQSESAARSAAPETSADELAESAPLSAQASAAADAASADLKTLQEQIAANPPSGAASPSGAADRRKDANADGMPSDYLGQTVDLYDGQTILPAPAHRDSLHRRARPRWRHGYGHQ